MNKTFSEFTKKDIFDGILFQKDPKNTESDIKSIQSEKIQLQKENLKPEKITPKILPSLKKLNSV